MRPVQQRRVVMASAILALVAGCGGEDAPVASASGSGSIAQAPSATGAPSPSAGEEGYRPASDVNPHLAIGQDVAAIKTAMDPATKDQPVDWAAVGKIFREGTGASKKGDGSVRTLQGLVPGSAQDAFVNAAIDGSGDSEGASDKVRRQGVEKGITVLLAEKVIEEYGKTREKIKAGNLTPPSSGAVHNVDEAWAFFVAEGNGPASTADKRAADFNRGGQVREGVLAALTSAKAAALAGDLAAFETAAAATQQALDYVFYLATYKYLQHADEVGKAEGQAFYRGISPRVEQADAAAHQAIVAALAGGDAAGGRAALNNATVLGALGVDDAEQVSG